MPSILERLELLITANAKDAVAGMKETALAANALEGETSKAGRAFTQMGVYARFGAAAAAAGIAALAFEGIKHFVDLTAQVRAYQRILGGTAEENSKIAAQLRMLGVDSEAAIKGFGLLTKNIGNGKDTLEEWGVTVSRNMDGNVNMYRTLLNIGDTFKSIEDPTKRAAFAAQNFGRGYQALIPYLSKSREELKAFGEEADKNHEVFSQEQLDQGREFSLGMRELKASTTGLAIALGQDLVPILTEFAGLLTDGVHLLDSFGREIGFTQTSVVALGAAIGLAAGGPTGALYGSLAALAAVAISTKTGFDVSTAGVINWGNHLAGIKTDKAVEEFQKLQHWLDTLPYGWEANNGAMKVFKTLADESPYAAQQIISGLEASGVETKKYTDVLQTSIEKRQAEASAAQEQATQNENLVATLDDVQSALLRTAGGQLGLEQSYVDLNKAQADLDTVLKEHPGDWEAIHEAQLKVDQANLNVAKSTLDLSASQEALGGTFAGGTQAAEEELARLKKLQEENPRSAASLQPLIDKLQTYIDFLNQVPPPRTAHVDADTSQFDVKFADVNGKLNYLDGRTVNPQIIATARVIADNPEAFFQHGGPVPGGANDPYPAVLHGGEYVLSADVVDRIKHGRQSRGARPPSHQEMHGGGGSGGQAGPQVIQLVVSGRVLAEVTAAEFGRAGGPQVPSRAISN